MVTILNGVEINEFSPDFPSSMDNLRLFSCFLGGFTATSLLEVYQNGLYLD